MSGRQRGDPGNAAKRDRPDSDKGPGQGKRKAGDIGRALRSIYNDTVREPVPDDFQDLLGKLS